MGFRRRTRRRALIAGAAVAHHEDRKYAQAEQAPAEDQQAAPAQPAEPAQYAPPPADPASEIEHFSQLHESGAMTDEEFATAKAKILGT
jgi:Short C-terminal domain